MYEFGANIIFCTDEPCLQCGYSTFTGVWFVDGKKTLLEGYCTRPQCNPLLLRGSSRGCNLVERHTPPPFEPLIFTWETCELCGDAQLYFTIKRGNKLVASECIACRSVCAPGIDDDALPTVRPPAITQAVFR